MSVAGMSQTPGGTASAGLVLALVRSGQAVTRSELIQATGLSRPTLAGRLDALLRSGYLIEAGTGATKGRPAGRFQLNDSAGVALAADLGATNARLAVVDLAGAALAERAVHLSISDGPEIVLPRVLGILHELLTECGKDDAAVLGTGMGVPGPVDFSSGRPVRPPIMPGWDDFDIRAWFASRLSAPVFIDNDVTVMARGEHRRGGAQDEQDVVFVKAGTGIGAGLILGGTVYRGDRGAAGDLGHVRIQAADGVLCRCGNDGCLEAVAGGPALAARLSASGLPAASTRDVARLVAQGVPEAIQATREAGRHIGEALATVVNLVNPQVIVIGGDLAATHDHLLAGIREEIYRRSTALATERLRITESRLGARAGIEGCAVLALDELLSPRALDQALTARDQQQIA
jgi:predicted NBD/HSP70 family sugar kinase